MIALTQTVELDTPIATVDVEADAGCTVELDERALEGMLQMWGGQVKGALLKRYTNAFIAADIDDVNMYLWVVWCLRQSSVKQRPATCPRPVRWHPARCPV